MGAKGEAERSSTSITVTCPTIVIVIEIKPGGKSEPEHHMYELTIYVVSGRGATTIWQDEKQEEQLRVAGRQPVFNPTQREVPKLQRQRPRAGALYRGNQRAADDASIPRQ